MLEGVQLWDHQKRAVALGESQKNLALFLEIGTGKTATLINLLRRDFAKHGRIRRTLIFAPLSVCPGWVVEFEKWSRISRKDILVLNQSGTKRIELLEARGDKPTIVVTNYEGMRIEKFQQALLKWLPEIVVLDESHRVKDAKALQSSRIYPLCDFADRRFLLTGTPVLNSMLDLFGQYRALDANIFGKNFWAFQARYFYNRNQNRPNCTFPDWQPRPEAAKLISAQIAATSVQAKKSECLDLPPLLKVEVPVEMSKEQAKAYADMKKHFVAELGGQVVTAEFAMTKSLRLRQILTGFLAENSEKEALWCKDVPRLEALSELFAQIGPKKTIVWTVFRPTYQRIAEVAEAAGRKVAFLTGDQSPAGKQAAIESFCRGDVDTLISNPSAGGAGINLQEAAYSIYYSKGFSLEHFLQSEGRNYRGGTEKLHTSVTHYHLYVEGTLDELISKALLTKQDVGETVLRWAREEMNNCT